MLSKALHGLGLALRLSSDSFINLVLFCFCYLVCCRIFILEGGKERKRNIYFVSVIWNKRGMDFACMVLLSI